jgi:hypothetical protein
VADYTDSKGAPGQVYPDGTDLPSAGGWQQSAPLITPEQVITKYLRGVDPLSGTRNSVTGKRDLVIAPEIIRDKIDDVIADLELEIGITIFPTQWVKKVPFDKPAYNQWGYLRLPVRPIASIESLKVQLSNDTTTYEIPLDWIETGNLRYGQLNLIPLTIALQKQGVEIPTSAAASAVVLTLLVHQMWVPAFFQVEATIGFPSGKIPKVLNDLIGTATAIEMLSMLAATYAKNMSGSLSIDGMSQSTSSPGPQIFKQRIDELMEKRKKLIKRFKTYVGLNFFSGEV